MSLFFDNDEFYNNLCLLGDMIQNLKNTHYKTFDDRHKWNEMLNIINSLLTGLIDCIKQSDRELFEKMIKNSGLNTQYKPLKLIQPENVYISTFNPNCGTLTHRPETPENQDYISVIETIMCINKYGMKLYDVLYVNKPMANMVCSYIELLRSDIKKMFDDNGGKVVEIKHPFGMNHIKYVFTYHGDGYYVKNIGNNDLGLVKVMDDEGNKLPLNPMVAKCSKVYNPEIKEEEEKYFL